MEHARDKLKMARANARQVFVFSVQRQGEVEGERKCYRVPHTSRAYYQTQDSKFHEPDRMRHFISVKTRPPAVPSDSNDFSQLNRGVMQISQPQHHMARCYVTSPRQTVANQCTLVARSRLAEESV